MGNFQQLFLEIFFLSPFFWDSHHAYIGMFYGFCRSMSLFIFCINFSFYSFDWIISINCFQAHWFFVVYWNLQLSLSSKFSFQLLLTFNCKTYTWFFSIISISLHFLFGKTFFSCFSSVDMISFSSLNISKIANQRFVYYIQHVGFHRDNFHWLLDFFPMYKSHTLMLLSMACHFFLKTGHFK